MKGVSHLTDEVGRKKAIVIDVELIEQRDSIAAILEDIEDEISIALRKDEESYEWSEVRAQLLAKD